MFLNCTGWFRFLQVVSATSAGKKVTLPIIVEAVGVVVAVVEVEWPLEMP